MCFVDLKKAFDSVNRLKLMVKLKESGIGNLAYNVIKNMYTQSKAKLSVKIGNELSEPFKSKVGLYQGEILSPLLFNLYINDLTQIIYNKNEPAELDNCPINCLMYADDIVLISKSQEGLQRSLNSLNEYCNEWDLTVNTDKTKVVVFNKRGVLNKCPVTYQGKPLKVEQEFKYLGILLSANGNMVKAKTDLSKRGQKALFKMKSMLKNTSISYNTSMHLFDHIIKPILTYGSDVWGHTYLNNGDIEYDRMKNDDIESCHLRYCRSVHAVSKKAPNIGIYGETGRCPLAIDAVLNSVKYWCRLQNIRNKDSLIYCAYNE